MMKSVNYKIACGVVATLAMCWSCGNAFLDVRPSVRQRVPHSFTDYMGLMDNITTMNNTSHALGMMGNDEYYIIDAYYNIFPSYIQYQKRAYTWEREIYDGTELYMLDWNEGYKRILWSNLALEGFEKIKNGDVSTEQLNMAKGTALFHRAWNYYNLAQLYCPVYDEGTAKSQLGLPLRLESDLTLRVSRASLADTYRQIVTDLETAERLLPDYPEVVLRPGKGAVYGLLARVALQMGAIDEALNYANSGLALHTALLDFNAVAFDQAPTFQPKGEGNPEVIFMASLATLSNLDLIAYYRQNPDTALMDSYAEGDLRAKAFFREINNGMKHEYIGSYDGTSLSTYFTGIATDELYLVRAECAARLGDVDRALADLNLLRKHRFESGTYEELASNDPAEVLGWVIAERKKELVWRGTRWEDLRRLNKEPTYATTLVRKVNGQEFTLPPQSERYVWPIPLDAVAAGGYVQNER